MSDTGGSCGQSAGNVVATSCDTNGWSSPPGSPHAAGVDSKAPPAPRAGFATGGEAEGGRAAARYVHKIGTSSQATAWTGTSRDGEEILSRQERDKLVRRTVNALNQCGRQKEAKALAGCGKYFNIWAKSATDVKLLPCPCDHMFCPECARRRARPLVKKLKGMVDRPGRSYWFLTLTVPNTENLSKLDVLELQGLWSKLWNHWVFQEVEDETGKPFRIFGAVRSIECVYNNELKSWHPHIHVLFEAPRRLPRWWLTLLKHAWIELSGDSRYCHLQRAYSYTKRGKKKYGRLNEKALREVCKYVTKCVDFVGDFLLVDEFLTAFKSVRRIQCCGSFYGEGAEEFCREPGEDEAGVGVAETTLCGEGYGKLPFKAHIRDTLLLGDGERQLCFQFRERVREHFESRALSWALVGEEVEASEQKRIEFAGVMPEKSVRQSSLFEGAA